MPPKKTHADKTAKLTTDKAVEIEDKDETRKFLEWMKQQMTDFAANNDATNAKQELFTIHYENLQGNSNLEVIVTTT